MKTNELIDSLKWAIEDGDKTHAEYIAQKRRLLQKEYEKIFDEDESLQKSLKSLQSSENYCTDINGDIMRYAHLNTNLCHDPHLDYALETYLSDDGIHWDKENNTVSLFEGDCIVINEEGEVFDGGKYLKIKYSDFATTEDTEEQRDRDFYESIDQYQEKQGVFSTVLRSTRYGDLFVEKGYYNYLKSKKEVK